MGQIIRRGGGFMSLGDMFAADFDLKNYGTISQVPSKKIYQKDVYRLFGRGVVAYHPGIAKKLKSVKAAAFLAQLLYWHDKGRKKGWIYKSVREFYAETGLKRKEQETAIKVLKNLQILEVKVEGVPPTRHFRVNLDAVTKLLIASPNGEIK